jgi:Fe-S-cluster containining protein
MSQAEAPWYREGLRFECTRCGACCTGAPGYVWVNEEEIAELAGHLGQSVAAFARKHLRRVGDRVSLTERRNGDCVFWDRDRGCTVYEARPIQCRTWPFWVENLEDEAAWEQTRQQCPGSGRGNWFSLEEIEAAARRTPP